VGEARPAWKVLRVLGNLLNLPGFDYQSSEEVLAEVRGLSAAVVAAPYRGSHTVAPAAAAAQRSTAPLPDVSMYQSDALVRRAPSLQRTREGRSAPVSY
jgi:NADH-quinone oxidoreductase subunit G